MAATHEFSLTSHSLWLGPILAFAAGFLLVTSGFSWDAAITLGVAIICVVWWILDPSPYLSRRSSPDCIANERRALHGTNLGRLRALPGFAITGRIHSIHGNGKSGAHLRVALTMVRAFGGTSSRRLVFGFMAASALLSMWISNTATTLMLLPVALAVIEKARDPALPVPLLLGVAYAASVGGIGTPIGTPPTSRLWRSIERHST